MNENILLIIQSFCDVKKKGMAVRNTETLTGSFCGYLRRSAISKVYSHDFYLLVSETVSVCIPGYVEFHFAAQADLELSETFFTLFELCDYWYESHVLIYIVSYRKRI